MVKGTKNCNGPNPHGKGNLSNKKTFKKCTPDTMFSQSTTIHYATLLSSALPCFFPTAPVAAIAIRGPVCVPVAREKNHTRLGSKGSTSAEKVSPRLRNIRKPDSQSHRNSTIYIYICIMYIFIYLFFSFLFIPIGLVDILLDMIKKIPQYPSLKP